MSLELAAAYWVLERLSGEELPQIAIDALQDGQDCESLRTLAGESPAPKRELSRLFERALKECGIDIPSCSEAAYRVARYHSTRILQGIVTPYEGARAIAQTTAGMTVTLPVEVIEFAGLEEQYIEFEDQTRISFYGVKRCEEIRAETETTIREKAKRILEYNV